MSASIVRRLRDGCLALGSLGTVLGGMAAIDVESRHYLIDALHGDLPPGLTNLPIQHYARMVTDTIPIGTSSMVALAVSGFVLLLLMLRT